MPVSGTVDNDAGLIAMYFSGVITLEEIITAQDEIFHSVHENIEYVEINFQNTDCRFYNIDIECMRAIKKQIMEKFENSQITRHKLGAILLSKEGSMIYPLWRSLVEPDERIKTKYQVFDTIEDACIWLGINPKIANNVLRNIGFDE